MKPFRKTRHKSFAGFDSKRTRQIAQTGGGMYPTGLGDLQAQMIETNKTLLLRG
jgi:hypothetical protein